MPTQAKQLLLSAITAILVGSLAAVATGCSVQEAETGRAVEQLVNRPEDQLARQLQEDDFRFPSEAPSLARGHEIFKTHCAECHTRTYWQQADVQETLAKTTPIDLYLYLTTNKKPDIVNPMGSEYRDSDLPETHVTPEANPDFAEEVRELSYDDRWAVLFYTRYLAGFGDIQKPANGEVPLQDVPEVAQIFGGNCAVCHGTLGDGMGNLHKGQTGNHEAADAPVLRNLIPPPAQFIEVPGFQRMYNRTDAQVFKYVCEGIYPSAMPSWYGNVHRQAIINEDGTVSDGPIVYIFDDTLITNLVRYVRQFAVTNDLASSTDPEARRLAANPPPGVNAYGNCRSVPTNQPWTPYMKQYRRADSQPESRQATPVMEGADQT